MNKNADNQTLLRNKREFDARRREAAIERKRLANLAAMRKVGGEK
jgi:hypothetical protein